MSDGFDRAPEPARPPDGAAQQDAEPAMAKPQVVVAPVLMSKLSANAPEFYPSGYASYTVRAPLPRPRGGPGGAVAGQPERGREDSFIGLRRRQGRAGTGRVGGDELARESRGGAFQGPP